MSIQGFPEENYWPMAFLANNIPVGAAYLCPWICPSDKKQNNGYPSLKSHPIRNFVTGMCLFGDDLTGIDQNGIHHPLTDPRYVLPDATLLQKVQSRAESHPYEQLIQLMLLNLSPLIKAFSENEQAHITFHLPIPEYLLFGIRLYLKNQITKAALTQYVNLVLQKGQWIKKRLHGIQLFTNIKMTISSPLDSLNLEEKILALSEMEKPAEHDFTQLIISQLIETESHLGFVWQHALQYLPQPDLLNINYLSYSAQIAASAIYYGAPHICLLDMFDEKTIGREYAKNFSGKFGSILALHWLPPILLHDNGKNSLYFCGEARDWLITLISLSQIIEGGLRITKLISQQEPELARKISKASSPGKINWDSNLFSIFSKPKESEKKKPYIRQRSASF